MDGPHRHDEAQPVRRSHVTTAPPSRQVDAVLGRDEPDVRQGQGFGTQMLECAAAAFMPATDIRLLVNRENTAAQAFYVRRGFERIGEKEVRMGDFPFLDYIYRKVIAA